MASTGRDDEGAALTPRGGAERAAAAGGQGATSGVPWRRVALMVLGIVLAVATGVAAGWRASARSARAQSGAWHGRVGRIARGAADARGGLTRIDGAAIEEGAEIRDGSRLSTDARTRARLDFDDGSYVVLDRATSVEIERAPRTLRLRAGALLVEVARAAAGEDDARVEVPNGELRAVEARLTVTSTADASTVEAVRGAVEARSAYGDTAHITAGEEAVLTRTAPTGVLPVGDLAARASFGDRLDPAATGDGESDATARGLGELRARRPGHADESERPVALVRHALKVRISGAVARTEIDETFRNDTADDLEGIYRFPLPPGAQIERLALEVDGALVEGAFVDKARAAAIWRGAIKNAAPRAPKPRDEIFWVPGPWRDPALLEWQQGGRFELRIFPVPRHGSRRIVVAYTERMPASGSTRRYVAPLPSASARIEHVEVDVQVVGMAPGADVRVDGYELSRVPMADASSARFARTFTDFEPGGDLGIAIVSAETEREANAWAYRDTPAEAGFVAIALRPRLPAWTDVRPRDQVVVVDSGRAMFGERFRRARRLAVEIARAMDRRDRLTVLACDIACRPMRGGFVAPGAAAAHDVDAFLAGVTPDGATDLVGAVRAAASLDARDAARDLRVLLVSDGASSAGLRTTARVADEVARALDAPRAAVIAVAVGADADDAMLGEIARGGGGVRIAYAAGQSLAAAALDVLNASYGRTLRDARVTLPAGLAEPAERDVAPVPAGGELLVLARLTAESAAGDVVLRGRVGGEPFERRYAIDVRATHDPGNAFVPRLYAAARIADLERKGGADARAELVALSRRYAVPSRATSLLVLESEAMFRAFGVDRDERGATWDGESASRPADIAAPPSREVAEPRDGELLEPALEGVGGGVTASALARATGGAPAPAKAAGPSFDASASPAPPAPSTPIRPFDDRVEGYEVGRPGRWMKRVWTRRATLADDGPRAALDAEVAAARAGFQDARDERSRVARLARALTAAGRIDELAEVADAWSARDPLDVDAIGARADVAAARGDREAALRIASGRLASFAVGADVASLASALAGAFERAESPAACALRVTVAEARPGDRDALARVVACSGERGAPGLETLGPEARADVASRAAALAASATTRNAVVNGDVVIDATWDAAGGVDLDLVVTDPQGRRISWASPPVASPAVDARSGVGGLRVADPRSRSHEALAWSAPSAGTYAIEVARAAGAHGPPVPGRLVVRALGTSRTFAFTLDGPRVRAARLDVAWTSALVPVPMPTAEIPRSSAFDSDAAHRALTGIPLATCRDGAPAAGLVRVTYEPATGRVIAASLDGIAYGSAEAGLCVTRLARATRVAPFDARGGASVVHRYVVR